MTGTLQLPARATALPNREHLGADPCLVGGTLVAARFEHRGFIVRESFRQHPRVLRWLATWDNPPVRTLPDRLFEQLAHDGIDDTRTWNTLDNELRRQ